MTAIPAGPLAYILRLVEGIPKTAENQLGRHEAIQELINILNILEKSEEDDDE